VIDIDDTHDVTHASWVTSANAEETDFPLQNLPLGVFRTPNSAPEIGVAIGDQILSLHRALQLGVLTLPASLAQACRELTLNSLLSRGRPAAAMVRRKVFELLTSDALKQDITVQALVSTKDAEMLLPVTIGDFTDFYTSINHARRGAQLSRPNLPPLYPNFQNLPVAYHGRSSSVTPSGTPCRRPLGQMAPSNASEEAPFRATAKLDFELEVGFYVGPGNLLGEPVSIDSAEDHIFGLCLVNDWSARDIQRWESQPLGPFQSKSFMTSVSPWIVTLEALAPFRHKAVEREENAPPLSRRLSSERHSERGAVDIALKVRVQSEAMRTRGESAAVITETNFAQQYWSIFQMLTHHTSNGCNLRSGDLLASGTVSGAQQQLAGCLFEMTMDGRNSFELPGGEELTYLRDGDEVQLVGRCERKGFRSIGFGVCSGVVQPAIEWL